MKIVTPAQMRELDRLTIEHYGIPSDELMERAGNGVAEAVKRHVLPEHGTVVILVGKGNNGGDGRVAARLLKEPSQREPSRREEGYDVLIVELEGDASEEKIKRELNAASCIVDALFGTGFKGPLEGRARAIVEMVAKVDVPVIAIDIPSGIDGTTGALLGNAITATETVTMGLPKLGLFVGEGAARSGKITVVDIGIPAAEIEKVETESFLITPQDFPELLRPRQAETHKGSYGHVLMVAGSKGKLGAGYLASRAALRAGAGLVSYVLPQGAFAQFDARFAEVMCEPIPDSGNAFFHLAGRDRFFELLKKKQVVAIGPALGTESETCAFFEAVIPLIRVPLVIDADGLNALALNVKLLQRRLAPTILTPHPGEMARLIKSTPAEVQKDRMKIARDFATKWKVILVLKGHRTLVATPEGKIFFNATGNPSMASAGMGDVLTGVIGGLLAQGFPPVISSLAAVYLHGFAGDLAAEKQGAGLIASDVVEALPHAFEAARKKSASLKGTT